MALNLEHSSPPPTSSFHLMCGYGEDQAVTQLIKNGASIDAMCELGLTPLNYAILAGHLNIVKILVESSDVSNTILSNIDRTRTSFFEHRTNSNMFINY